MLIFSTNLSQNLPKIQKYILVQAQSPLPTKQDTPSWVQTNTPSIISGVFSILAILFSIFFSIKKDKDILELKNTYDEKLLKLKQDLEQAQQERLEKIKAKNNIEINFITDRLNAIRDLSEKTQNMKEWLSKIYDDYNESVDLETAMDKINKIKDEIVEIYAKNHSNFSDADKNLIHHLKNDTSTISKVIAESIKGKQFASQLDETEKNKMRKFRENISDHQIKILAIISSLILSSYEFNNE